MQRKPKKVIARVRIEFHEGEEEVWNQLRTRCETDLRSVQTGTKMILLQTLNQPATGAEKPETTVTDRESVLFMPEPG